MKRIFLLFAALLALWTVQGSTLDAASQMVGAANETAVMAAIMKSGDVYVNGRKITDLSALADLREASAAIERATADVERATADVERMRADVECATRHLADKNLGEIVMEARSSRMNFDEIEVFGSVRLVVEERTAGNIVIRAPKRLMEYVILYVSDNTLHAGLRLPGNFSRRGIPSCAVEIYIPNNGRIAEIVARGASRVKVLPTLSGAELDVEAGGASSITLATTAVKVSVELYGASTLKIDTQSREVEAEVSGASTLKCFGAATALFDVEVSGASTLVADDFVAEGLELEVSGASSATAKCATARVDVAGASTATIECSTSLDASASAASTVRYKGDCAVNLRSVTGASSIKKL